MRQPRTLTNEEEIWTPLTFSHHDFKQQYEDHEEEVPLIIYNGSEIPSALDLSFQQILQMANVNEPNLDLCLDLLREKIIVEGLPIESPVGFSNSQIRNEYIIMMMQ